MVPAPTAGQLEPGAPARVPTFTPEGGDLIVIWNGACEPVSICAGENFLNQSALREAGLSGAQFLHSYLQRSAWVPYSEFKSHAARLLSGMARELPPFRLDFTLLNGQRLQTEIQIGLLPTPEPYRLISIVRDISARRLQEQRWSESESLC